MSGGWVIFLFAVGAVGLFALGMSITLIFKGHNLESDVGTNRHMKQKGIKCASHQFRLEERQWRKRNDPKQKELMTCGGDQACSTCTPIDCQEGDDLACH